jgi:hypothetical protein
MSTPDGTVETSELESTSRDKQDDLTERVGTRLATQSPGDKTPWWKRLLGRG